MTVPSGASDFSEVDEVEQRVARGAVATTCSHVSHNSVHKLHTALRNHSHRSSATTTKQNNGHRILTKICIGQRWPFVRFQDGDPSAILDSLGLQINATEQMFTAVALFQLVWNSLLDCVCDPTSNIESVEHLLRTWSCSRDTSACGALGNTQLLATVKLCWITYCSRPVTIHREAETRNQFSFVCFFFCLTETGEFCHIH